MQSSIPAFLAGLAIMLPAFIVALSFHEFCHALVATLLGDDTPRKQGRLTLNPMAHVDMLGLFFLMIFRVGWARPVEFDGRNFKHRKFYSVLTALAGPCANFLLALIGMYLLAYLPLDTMPTALAKTLNQVIMACIGVNIMLGVFNLLPLPPLDGSHILMAFIADRLPKAAMVIYRYSFFVLLFIFLIPQTRTMLLYLMMWAQQLLQSLVI